MGKLNHRAIKYGDITSDIPVESNFYSVLDPDTTPIKSIDDDEMDHLLEFLHSENYEDILYVDLQMLQAWLVVAPPSKFYSVEETLQLPHATFKKIFFECALEVELFKGLKRKLSLRAFINCITYEKY